MTPGALLISASTGKEFDVLITRGKNAKQNENQ